MKIIDFVIKKKFVICAALLMMSVLSSNIAFSLKKEAIISFDQKTKQAIISNERPFRVIEESKLLTESGRQIDFDVLSVPCKAQVVYELEMDEDPLIFELKVLETFMSSSPHVDDPGQE